jgi:hypothetical protein
MVFERIQTAHTQGFKGLSHGSRGDSKITQSAQITVTDHGHRHSKSHFVVAIHGVDYDGDRVCPRGV